MASFVPDPPSHFQHLKGPVYNRYGRIYVRTGSGDIVPIYGLSKRCPAGYNASPYWVKTYDKNTCVLGYRRYHNDHNRGRGNR